MPPNPNPSLSIALLRRYITTTTTATKPKPKPPPLSHIPSKYRRQAINQAKLALTDYLHSTRSLPFTYADHIVSHSTSSLSLLLSRLPFSAPNFPHTLRKFLLYNPINEFDFFFDSIGIHHNHISDKGLFFISQEPRMFNVACLLCGFGFPWDQLGVLYLPKDSIFMLDCGVLGDRIEGLKGRGFGSLTVVAICLTFPCVLSGEDSGIVDDLKRVFVDFGLEGCVEGNVEALCEVCRKIRVFYELGLEEGGVGELMGRCKSVFVEYSEDVLVEKVGFWCGLGVSRADVGLLLLERPELLRIDVKTPRVSVVEVLRRFGADEEALRLVEEKYPYVVGRNKMSHLPCALRAVELHEWFFDKIKHGDHCLLSDCALSSADDGIDEKYAKGVEKIRSFKTHAYKMRKLNFLHSIGFAENSYSIKILVNAHGSSSELQERFDALLATGIGFSKLCKMLSRSPKILNQEAQVLTEKVNYLSEEIGLPVEYLESFPAYLCFDLEKRIKPRYRFHTWLEEQGLCSRKYKLGSMIATSEKNFIARLSLIHPTATRLWYEYISCKNDNKGRQQETSISQEP